MKMLKNSIGAIAALAAGIEAAHACGEKAGVYAKDWGSRTFVSHNRLSLGF